MGCFPIEWLKELAIAVVIILFFVAVIKLLLPKLLGSVAAPPGAGSVVATILTILGWALWTAIAIVCIIIVFDLVVCLVGTVGTGPSLGYHRY